ncbi:MAG: hypothetical protein WBA13_07905 [Microcoleaceae cyanobacterium]
MNLVPIYFYLHPQHFPTDIPERVEENWSGFGIGIYAWTIQTYLRLKQQNLPCFLVNEIPDEGIVFIHRNILTRYHPRFKPSKKLLLICLKAESNPFPYAQIQVVQNPIEIQNVSNSYYLPHWTQPGLIPRDPNRGEIFENIAFFGHKNNLAPEFISASWQQYLTELDLNWLPIINQNTWQDYQSINPQWNDYSQIDAIVAIRGFDKRNTYTHKPATKLYNAWLAGVPAILGYESAYRTEGHPNQDYIEVASWDELLSALIQLKHYPALRETLVNLGNQQAKKFNPDIVTQRWYYFITTIAIPAYENWCQTPRGLQQIILEKNYLNSLIQRSKLKLKSKFLYK